MYIYIYLYRNLIIHNSQKFGRLGMILLRIPIIRVMLQCVIYHCWFCVPSNYPYECCYDPYSHYTLFLLLK